MSRYDHPNQVITREEFMGQTTAGNGTASQRWYPYQKAIAKLVMAVVVTAGTSATTGNKLDVYHGTTSVASITLGTSAAGFVGTATLNETIAGLGADYLEVKNGTDATGKSYVSYLWQALPDAVQPA